ncbi:MAG: hypothetical protein ACKOCD_02290 [Nitrospiraceae bacterium]
MTTIRRPAASVGLLVLATLAVVGWTLSTPRAWAQGATDFPGTVLTVDPAAGKLAVKKDGGGTRFTFTVNEKTQFEGAAKSLKDVKKDDKVTVLYVVTGRQYLAQKIVKK